MLNSVDIRPATKEDIQSLLEIEKLCFLAPWNEKGIAYELNENPVSVFYVLEYQNKVIGFIDYWHTFDSATLAQIAVHPDYQKQHLADMLMDEMISDCHAKKVEFITLEVRVNNSKAINLYKKHNFENILVKPHYYTNGDDAYYMIRKVEM